MANKSDIHIKESKKGTFTAAAKKHGMGVQEFARKVLANKDSYSPAMRKKANFAKNASKFKHPDGGMIYADGGMLPGLLQTGLGIGAMFVPGMQGVGAGMIAGGAGNLAGQIVKDINPSGGSIQSSVNNFNPIFCKGGKVRMPYGGVLDTRPVELEEGEPFMTPDNKIATVSTSAPTHAEGGVPLNLEPGTKILGKNIDPVSGMQFKQLGRKLAALNKKAQELKEENKSTYSNNAARAMMLKAQHGFNDAMERQEAMKVYANGGYVGIPKAWNGMEVLNDKLNISPDSPLNYNFNNSQLPLDLSNASYSNISWPDVNKLGDFKGLSNSMKLMLTYNPSNEVTTKAPVQQTQVENKIQPWQRDPSMEMHHDQKVFYNPTILNDKISSFDNLGIKNYNFQPNGEGISFGNRLKANLNNNDLLYNAASLAPVAYNLIQGFGKSEQLDPKDYYNKEHNRAISLMLNRRANVDPLLAQNEANQRSYEYNLRNSGASGASYKSGLLGGTANRMAADSSVLANANNMNNQYMAEEASMRANLGAQQAQTKLGITDINSANEAARRNYLSQGFSNISDYAQMNKYMNNQKMTDEERYKIMMMMYKFSPQWFGNMFNERFQ